MSKTNRKILQITWSWERVRDRRRTTARAHVYLVRVYINFKYTFFWTLFPFKPVLHAENLKVNTQIYDPAREQCMASFLLLFLLLLFVVLLLFHSIVLWKQRRKRHFAIEFLLRFPASFVGVFCFATQKISTASHTVVIAISFCSFLCSLLVALSSAVFCILCTHRVCVWVYVFARAQNLFPFCILVDLKPKARNTWNSVWFLDQSPLKQERSFMLLFLCVCRCWNSDCRKSTVKSGQGSEISENWKLAIYTLSDLCWCCWILWKAVFCIWWHFVAVYTSPCWILFDVFPPCNM